MKISVKTRLGMEDPEEFEKTPKKSIKRYLYQEAKG